MELMSTDEQNMNSEFEVKQIPHLNRQHHLMLSSLNGLKKIYETRKEIAEGALRMLENDSVLLKIIGKPWQSFENGNFIICVPIRNDYNNMISDIQLFIIEGCFNEVETRVSNFICSPYRLCSKNELASNGSAYVVGIVNIKDFHNLFNDCRLSCSILFKMPAEGSAFSEKELLIPTIELNIVDIIKGKIGLFSDNNNVTQDVITSIVISDIVVLELHLKESSQFVNLPCVLINNFHFIEVKVLLENCVYYVMNSSKNHMFNGLVVYVQNASEDIVSVVCYSRNVNQIALFKHSLCVLLKDNLVKVCEKEEKFCVSNMSMLTAVNAMNQEFKHFTATMKMGFPDQSIPIRDERNLKFTAHTWNKLMECNKTLDTDYAIQTLSSL